MPNPRMTLCDRLIGGVVQGIADAIETVASFWQTPREVEWAKAAADGLAEREDEEDVAEPYRLLANDPELGLVGYVGTDGVTRVERAGVKYDDAMERHHRAVRGLHEAITALVPETSATTPGAESGPAEGEPPEPSAGVGPGVLRMVCGQPFCLLTNGDGTCAVHCPSYGVGGAIVSSLYPARSAEVEPPASAPSVESPAPEFDWVTTAIPVIAGVLAEHNALDFAGRVSCADANGRLCGEFGDWEDWRDHVAPRIAIAIQSDLLSTIYEDTTFAINAFSGDRPRPLADFPKHQK